MTNNYQYLLGRGLRVFGFLNGLGLRFAIEHGRDRIAIDGCRQTHSEMMRLGMMDDFRSVPTSLRKTTMIPLVTFWTSRSRKNTLVVPRTTLRALSSCADLDECCQYWQS